MAERAELEKRARARVAEGASLNAMARAAEQAPHDATSIVIGEPSEGTKIVDKYRPMMNDLTPEQRRHYQEVGLAMIHMKWFPIDTAPKNGDYILLAGPSGYINTPLRVEVCRYDAKYRPLQPWVNHSNDSFTDGGEAPTHWMPLPIPT